MGRTTHKTFVAGFKKKYKTRKHKKRQWVLKNLAKV